MITTHSQEPRYFVQFTNGTQAADADAPSIKGGKGAGFGPHELLEASLASCINMWIRMQADLLGVSVGPIVVTVNLKRDHPEAAVYEYTVKLDGALSEEQRAKLLQAADNCPVRSTLCKLPVFTRRDP